MIIFCLNSFIQATKINAWGSLVNQNIQNLTDLDGEVKKIEKHQKNIDRELDLIVSMQQELSDMITPLEQNMQKEYKKHTGWFYD